MIFSYQPDDLQKLLILAFSVPLVVSTALVVIVRDRIARRLKVGRSGSLRDQHSEPVPRLGGIGIAGAFLGTVLLLVLLPVEDRGISFGGLRAGWLQVVVLGGAAAFALGMVDDLYHMRARYKLFGQIAIALFVSLSGFVIESVDLPLFGSAIPLGGLSIPVTVLWIVGAMNAVNLIDGLDGLAGAAAMIAFAAFGYIAVLTGRPIVVILCCIGVGSTLGFWWFNRAPASIFMGDSGSLFLGFMLANVGLLAVRSQATGAVNLVPALVLGLPILDTAFALFRRWLKGVPFYSADRDHLHHRLLHKGMSPVRTLAIMSGAGAAFGILGIAVYWLPAWHTLFYLLAVLIAYFILFALQYEFIKKPIASLRAQPDLKRRRQLVGAVAVNADLWFGKDETRAEVIRSFGFWADLLGLGGWSVFDTQELVASRVATASADLSKHLVYRLAPYEVCVDFADNDLNVDADVKGEHLDQVAHALMNRLAELAQDDDERETRPQVSEH